GRDEMSLGNDGVSKKLRGTGGVGVEPPAQHFIPPQVALRGIRGNRNTESHEVLTDQTSKSLLERESGVANSSTEPAAAAAVASSSSSST
ncbi:MAG: hypothetical protein Q8P67_11870, partial [archaeon]|nr:hypothetical protein [archaeon]